MVEPEVAFNEIGENMDLAEDFLKYLIRYALDHCQDDLEFLCQMYDKELIDRLKFVVDNDFVRLPYTEGVKFWKSRAINSNIQSIGAPICRANMSVSW